MAVQPPVEPARGPISRIAVPPAARSVQGHRAGIVTRLLAGVVDGLVAVVAVAAGYGGVVAVSYLLHPRGFSVPDPGFGPLLVAFLALLTCYLGIAWATTGRTYGDRLLGLRVVDAHGRRVRPVVALVRALLYVLVPLLLFWVVVSRENRSVADVLLRTSVVYDWVASEPADPPARGGAGAPGNSAPGNGAPAA